jgi:uncharacterized protein
VTPIELASVDGIHLEAVVHHPSADVEALGTVIQAHGVTVDMNEGGMYKRLAARLAGSGFTVLRFSYRGHGGSGGSQRGVTIAGEMLDLQAAVELAADFGGPLSLVAASFGAVSSALSLRYLDSRIRSLVLWCPVLDLRATFLEPDLPWGVENFGQDAQDRLRSDGFLLVDHEFELGRVLFEEMRHYQLDRAFAASTTPALVIHGDQDTYVSYDVARKVATARASTEFHTVVGSDHGFDSRQREDEAIEATHDWLVGMHR